VSAITKLYRKMLAALLTLFGFSSTVAGCWLQGYGADEYGAPFATYKVKGVVVSEEGDNPIRGIRAALEVKYQYDSEEHISEIGSALTNNNGIFTAEGGSSPNIKILFIKLTDVDGGENGLFETKIVEADFTNATFTGSSGNWQRGEAEIDLGIIKMKPDNSDAE